MSTTTMPDRFTDQTIEDAASFAQAFGVDDVITAERFDAWGEERGRYRREDADHVSRRNELRQRIIPALQRRFNCTIITLGLERYQLKPLGEGLRIKAERFPNEIERVNKTKVRNLQRTARALQGVGDDSIEARLLIANVEILSTAVGHIADTAAEMARGMLAQVLQLQAAREAQQLLLADAEVERDDSK